MNNETMASNGRDQIAASARTLNETIAKAAERLGGRTPTDFFCECGDSGCRKTQQMTIPQYQRARRSGAILAHEAMQPPAAMTDAPPGVEPAAVI